MAFPATQVLRDEHDAILEMLTVAERVGAQLEHGEPVPPATLSGILEFLRLFADTCHHGKEEDLLFPLLEKKGMPRQGGPIGVMLHEHDTGRALIRQMRDASEKYAQGDREAGTAFARATSGYIALLREHIYKENNILFMMAERMLSEDEQQELKREFDRVESEKLGSGTRERLLSLLQELSAAAASTP